MTESIRETRRSRSHDARRADRADDRRRDHRRRRHRRDCRAGLEIKARSQWDYARRRFLRHRLAHARPRRARSIIFGAGMFANFVAPYSYSEIDLNNILLGADDCRAITSSARTSIGRDYFSRVVWGIRTSEEVGVFVAVVSSIIGSDRRRDRRLLRRLDRQPADALHRSRADVAGARDPADCGRALGQGSQWRISFILAFFFWTGIARIVRGVFLSLREKEYVEAAKASGAGDSRIMFRHILPNTLGPIIVNGTLAVGAAILTEAALSFLGFGIKPPTPSLGVLIADGADESAAVVADGVPRPDDRADRPLRQLRRRRPPRRARSDSRGESVPEPILSITESRRRVLDRRRHRPRGRRHLRTTSIPARRSASSASRAPARASDDVDPRADPAAAGPHRERDRDVQGPGSAEDEEARAAPVPRRRGRDGLPGSDDVAQPGAEGRLPARRGDQDALSEGEGRQGQASA